MKPLPNAFEVAYGPSFEVLDHSEVFFGGLLGTPSFAKILPNFEDKLSPSQICQVEQLTALFPRIQQWVGQQAFDETFPIGNDDLTVTWQRPVERAAVFSVLVGCKVALVSLVVCRPDDADEDQPPWQHLLPVSAFMNALNRFVPEGDVDHRKLRLATMTQRPLLASMFWAPCSPLEDSVPRTVQLQMAYSFFQMNGDLV